MMRRKGFTIVELLMVLGIIAVLMGIITTAASSSIRATRSQRMNALCTLVQTGLATYREQVGEWPVPALNAETVAPRDNHEGPGGANDPNKVVLNATEVRQAVKALVERAKQNSPVMDISGLFVARENNELSSAGQQSGGKGASAANAGLKKVYGMDFMTAIHGTKQSRKKMSSSEMYFGYPDPETGYFLRFKMVYSIVSDELVVLDQRGKKGVY